MPVTPEITTTDWVTSIGTVGSVVAAVGVAVWFGVFQPRRRRPKLTLDGPETLIAPLLFENAPSLPATWLRVRVHNERDRDAAEDAQAVLVSVKSGPSATQLTERALAGWSLKWTAIDDDKALLPPGVARYINIGYSTTYHGASIPRFQLQLHNPPGDDRGSWTDLVADVELVVAARNANGVSACYRVSLEGGVLTATRL